MSLESYFKVAYKSGVQFHCYLIIKITILKPAMQFLLIGPVTLLYFDAKLRIVRLMLRPVQTHTSN